MARRSRNRRKERRKSPSGPTPSEMQTAGVAEAPVVPNAAALATRGGPTRKASTLPSIIVPTALVVPPAPPLDDAPSEDIPGGVTAAPPQAGASSEATPATVSPSAEPTRLATRRPTPERRRREGGGMLAPLVFVLLTAAGITVIALSAERRPATTPGAEPRAESPAPAMTEAPPQKSAAAIAVGDDGADDERLAALEGALATGRESPDEAAERTEAVLTEETRAPGVERAHEAADLGAELAASPPEGEDPDGGDEVAGADAPLAVSHQELQEPADQEEWVAGEGDAAWTGSEAPVAAEGQGAIVQADEATRDGASEEEPPSVEQAARGLAQESPDASGEEAITASDGHKAATAPDLSAAAPGRDGSSAGRVTRAPTSDPHAAWDAVPPLVNGRPAETPQERKARVARYDHVPPRSAAADGPRR